MTSIPGGSEAGQGALPVPSPAPAGQNSSSPCFHGHTHRSQALTGLFTTAKKDDCFYLRGRRDRAVSASVFRTPALKSPAGEVTLCAHS